MKIAITATGPDLQSPVDARFGRAQYFIIYDAETQEFDAFENINTNVAHGAGIQSALFISSKGIGVVITGRVGPNAFQALTTAGIQILEITGGTVAQVIEAYQKGKLPVITEAGSAHGGLGMGGRRGAGRGR